MRAFGFFFIMVGAGLIGLSARAISDPDSPIGWGRWTDDPWSAGLIAGFVIVVGGCTLIIAKRLVKKETERKLVRILSAVMVGAVGIVLGAPVSQTILCVDRLDGASGCLDQSWSTLTGFTFSGSAHPWFGVLVASAFAVVAWLLVGWAKRSSSTSRRFG
ncbi:MAG: hypothetical protein GEU71_02730 [Actinobacteria bacterium]|nr:hypothetical protein [Actinomycetota bacterium]